LRTHHSRFFRHLWHLWRGAAPKIPIDQLVTHN
jgi:hypothetical protein